MALPLPWLHMSGIVAGLLIVLVGLFVLLARPGSALHRGFFLLALADGVSTVLYRLSYLHSVETGALMRGLFWYYYLAFVGILVVFGLYFPKPISSGRVTAALAGGAILVTVALEVHYARDHLAYWRLVGEPWASRFAVGEWGNAVGVAFVLATGLILARSTLSIRRDPSASHRRQAAFVVGGMVLAFGAQPVAILLTTLLASGPEIFFRVRLDRIVAYWVYAAFTLALAASVALVARRGRATLEREDLRSLFACYLGVLALAGAALAFSDPAVTQVARQLALLAYPLLLGYAILRYEVFDIDRQLRRAATVTMVASGLGITFILAENAVETFFADRLSLGLDSQWIAGSVAAVATAITSIPVLKASRKVVSRVIPELSTDEIQIRKLEIYRHSLAGALADGILREGESRTLAALRSTLGISDAEHRRLLAEVAT